MVNMLAAVKEEFPELYTKQGQLVKREPKKYTCECGHSFSKLKTTFSGMGIKMGAAICDKCGERAKKNVAYGIWKRMKTNQIEQEDFILNLVEKRGAIRKEDLEQALREQFDVETDALGTLVYFGYLTVDEKKRKTWKMIEYSLAWERNFDKRYETIS